MAPSVRRTVARERLALNRAGVITNMLNRFSSNDSRSPQPAGFTLIEILVVVAIIGLLTAILVPSLNSARRSAKRTACSSNLHQLGIAIRAYLNDSKDILPFASELPSFPPPPIPLGNNNSPFAEPNPPIFLADVLAPHLKGDTNVLRCPSDTPGNPPRETPYANQSYFETERSSYQINRRLRGRNATEARNQLQKLLAQMDIQRAVSESQLWFLKDYAGFHGKPGADGAFRYLYVDGHVTGFEGY